MRSPVHIALVVALALLALVPASSLAGEYSVTACFGTENGSWSEWEPTPGATAYVACPGGVLDLARPQSGEGMVVRNVAGPPHAGRGTTAALTFDAPAGTTITGIDFDARLLTNPGWTVGVFDASRGAWLWCGTRCLTTANQWVHNELRGLATRRIQALVRCEAPRCRSDLRRAVIALRHARVYLADDSAPAVTGVRGGLMGDGWLRGVQDVAFDAGDNSGIRAARIELDGHVVHDAPRGCDDTRPVPCSNGATGALLDTRTWADGTHALRLGAMDAGGNWTWVERTVHVDNTPPAEPAPALDGGADWTPARTRTLAVPLPDAQAAPLVRARVKACRVGGGCAESAPALEPRAAAPPAATVPVTAVEGPGEYAVRLALEDAAGNIGPYSPPVTLRFDDAPAGAPDVSAADRWHHGGALSLDAEGERPVSGIRGYRVRIGGRDAIVATSLPLDELPEGGTPVEVRAVSGAGVESTAVRTILRLDRTRPVVEASGVPAPDAWSRDPVRIALRARDQAGLSGVQSLAWSLDGGEEEPHEGDEAAVEIATDGRHTVGYRAIDAAGNSSRQHTAPVRVDRTPPDTVAFEVPDPADPTLVRVVVADATSGVARGRIELRREGGRWQRMPTSLEDGRLVTRLEDATLRAGAYELRAIVADAAGNEAIGTRRVDGAPAAVTLPLRRHTVVTVRRSGRALRAQLTAGRHPLADRDLSLTQRVRGRVKWRAVCGKRVVVIAYSAQATLSAPASSHSSAATRARVTPPSPASPPALAAIRAQAAPSSRASPPASAATRARVTPSSPASPPAFAATHARVTSSAGSCPLRTDGAGRVEVRLPAGPSRSVRVSFAGDALLLPAHDSASVRTPSRARFRATPRTVPAGGAVRFAGRLRGGHVPRAGKLVELQARVEAGWRTFTTLRTDRRGRFRHTHRFAAVSSGRTYWFRLRVPRETAYPFESVTTRPLAVRVR
jgi:hypothetical protein